MKYKKVFKRIKKNKFLKPIVVLFSKVNVKIKNFLKRRPHRSFRVSKRRDYKKKVTIPGYFSLTSSTHQIIWKNKKLFGSLLLVYAVLTFIFIGIASQDLFNTLSDLLKDTGSKVSGGDFGSLGQAALLALTTVAGGATQNLTELQQVMAIFFGVYVWLTTVWILRNKLSGNKFKLRDAIYNSGGPFVPTLLISLLLIIQLVPFSLAVVIFSAAQLTGIAAGGVESMLLWAGTGLLITLSLYWLSATFFAMIIATLPGAYPWQAYKTASDIVTGRRLTLLYRIFWLALLIVIVWILIVLPAVIFNTWLGDIWPFFRNIPFIPILILIMSTATLIWSATYIYLLYRKIVDDAAKKS